MVAVVVADYDIGGCFERSDNGAAYLCPHVDLQRMRPFAPALIPEGHARIDYDVTVSRRHHSAQTAHPERLGADDFNSHHSIQ